MSGIRILGAGHCLPEKTVDNEAFSRLVDTSDQWIRSRTGIRERRFCTEETHLSLCEEAARQAMDRAGVVPEQIGAVIVATMTPDRLMPSAACLLQGQLGLPEDTVCLDLNAACSGFVYGLHTMSCLLAAAERKIGLVVGGEVMSRIVDFTDRSTCVLFGDGAGAAVVRYSEDCPPLSACLGVRCDERALTASGPGPGRSSFIAMDGPAVFRFAVETLPRCVDQVLAAAGRRAEEVDWFLFHQANERILDLAAKKCGIPPEKCGKNVDRCGNTSAASIPILLSQMCEDGRIRPGQRLLCAGFGGGLSWGGVLIEMEEKHETE